MRVDLGKDRFAQPVSLQKMAEVEDRGLVGNAVVTQFDPGKAAHRLAVIQRLFRRRVAQRIPFCRKYTRSITSSGSGVRPPFGPAFG